MVGIVNSISIIVTIDTPSHDEADEAKANIKAEALVDDIGLKDKIEKIGLTFDGVEYNDQEENGFSFLVNFVNI